MLCENGHCQFNDHVRKSSFPTEKKVGYFPNYTGCLWLKQHGYQGVGRELQWYVQTWKRNQHWDSNHLVPATSIKEQEHSAVLQKICLYKTVSSRYTKRKQYICFQTECDMWPSINRKHIIENLRYSTISIIRTCIGWNLPE